MSTPGTVLITGTTSGVGLNATRALVKRGWTVITANRSPQRAAAAADELDLPKERLKHVLMDLGDLDSVRRAVEALPERLDAVVCNAAVYKPKLKQPERSPQGYEISMATNHFGHFLLVQLLLDRLKASSHPSKRVVILGTVTANSKELGGKIPIPAPADLGDLSGFEAGFKDPIAMASGKPFKPGKWNYAEPTLRGATLGWDVVNSGGKLPEFGMTDASQLAVAYSHGRKSEAGIKFIDWNSVKQAVVTGVLAALVGGMIVDIVRGEKTATKAARSVLT